jgi:ubiquitin-conjugating enzyme E2 J2
MAAATADVVSEVKSKRLQQNKSKGTTATQRLRMDYMRIMKDPVPYVTAHPLSSNILEWYYVVRGPEGSPYEGGLYHGKLTFPAEFPFKPPSIYMLTPNGRFKTNIRLCLSISDYHPDTWNPAWSVSTILTGLLSFMLESNPTMGSIETSDYEKKVFAKQSGDFNLNNKVFVELFPDLVEEIKEKKRKLQMEKRNSASSVSGKVAELGNTIRSHGIRNGIGVNHGNNNNEDGNGFISSIISTSVVVVVFVAFLYTVRYVLNTISTIS